MRWVALVLHRITGCAPARRAEALCLPRGIRCALPVAERAHAVKDVVFSSAHVEADTHRVSHRGEGCIDRIMILTEVIVQT